MLAASNFTDANLCGADPPQCDLRGAIFTSAVLYGARFDGARAGTLPETGMKTVFPAGFAVEQEAL